MQTQPNRMHLNALLIGIICLPSIRSANAEPVDFARAGSVLLSGGLGYMYESGTIDIGGDVSDTANHSFSIGPDVGAFIVDGLYLGLSARYYMKKSTTEDGVTSTESSLIIGARPAYYAPLNSDNSVAFYVRGLLGYTDGESTTDNDNNVELDIEYQGLAAGAGLGIALAFGAETGGVVQFGLEYLYQDVTFDVGEFSPDIGSTLHTFTVAIDFGAFL